MTVIRAIAAVAAIAFIVVVDLATSAQLCWPSQADKAAWLAVLPLAALGLLPVIACLMDGEEKRLRQHEGRVHARVPRETALVIPFRPQARRASL